MNNNINVILININRLTWWRLNKTKCISLEAFSVTEFNEIFLGRKLCLDVKIFQHFRACLCSYFQSVLVIWLNQNLPNNQLTLKMELVPEMLENLHIWMWLYAWENFIEDKIYVASASVSKVYCR
jgi:hypothetical protein